ncbi:MAG TPA: 4-hydroxy-3-methylbut-2-enyl diphosphate reductase [Gemmatimonadales bacterium]
MDSTYYRKGFGLKREIAEDLTSDYHSDLVSRVREQGHSLVVGDLTFRLAKEFGFCYGVDRAVEYAYETRRKFPDKRIFLVGEIIHNPHVNQKLEEMGINLLGYDDDGEFDFSGITADDAVLMPAFGVSVRDFERLRQIECVVVDTTCGSVLNVWKRVERYANSGFTALVHGKYYHEETKATVSQVTKYENGKYLIVRNMDEALLVCRFIEHGDNLAELRERFARCTSPGFDFTRDLARVGVANQTTMLAGESLAIAHRVGQALRNRYGTAVDQHFQSFDTICSATQDRQDAVIELMKEPLDVMIVIGGYNSSNTNNLAQICARAITTYHISDASCIETDAGRIRHKPVGSREEGATDGWLDDGVHCIGITAGASTPNNKIGEAIARVLETKGLAVPV